MKNIKLKYFAVLLMMILQWSCATTEIPQASENISKTDLFGEESMLSDYKTFKIDGVVTIDVNKISAMMKNANAVHYNPEEKEVNFYSSEAIYRKYNTESKEVEAEIENDKNSKRLRTASPDLGDFGPDFKGIKGLGDILDQQYFRDFGNGIFFSGKNGLGERVFIKFQNKSTLSTDVLGLLILNDASVESYDFSMSVVLSSVNAGNSTLHISNDTSGNRKVTFYENSLYQGRKIIIDLTTNKQSTLAKGFLNSIGGTVRSYNAVSY